MTLKMSSFGWNYNEKYFPRSVRTAKDVNDNFFNFCPNIWEFIPRNVNSFYATDLFLYPLKTSGFLMVSGGIDWDQLHDICWCLEAVNTKKKIKKIEVKNRYILQHCDSFLFCWWRKLRSLRINKLPQLKHFYSKKHSRKSLATK